MKKKFLPIFLLFILIAPAFLVGSVFHFEKKELKNTIQERMIAANDGADLIVLKFTNAEVKNLEWEDEKEFEYNGKMYDILESWNDQHFIFFKCWLDAEETELEEKLKKMVAKAFSKDKKNRDKGNQFYSFIQSFYFTDLTSFSLSNYSATSAVTINSNYLFQITSAGYSPPSPPPRFS